MAPTGSQYDALDAVIVAAAADEAEAWAAGGTALAAAAPVAAAAAPVPPAARAPSYAGMARDWAMKGLDPGSGGGVLPDAAREHLPPTQWADRGRDRSSAGGSAPEPKRPHMQVLTRGPPAVAKTSRSPRAKSPSITATTRERRLRQAHFAGPPQDLERYAADGRARRMERLQRAASAQN